jgi:TetR/AcrR family transcriptional regulator, fatty acid metabolism regulator protein
MTSGVAVRRREAPASLRRRATRLPRERRVGDIIEAARVVFAECGYEDASMAAIADRAGVVEGTIYTYFANKRDLLNRVLARWYEGMLADQAEALAGISGTRNRLRYVIWRHLRTIATEPALCRLFFQEVRSAGGYHASDLHALNRGYTAAAMQVLREGVAAGELRDDAPMRLVRDVIYGTIEHHTWDFLSGRGTLDVEGLADALSMIVLDGTRRAEERPTIERLERLADRLEDLAAGREP